MSDVFWLSERQFRRIEPYFPRPHGIPRVDDRRVISGFWINQRVLSLVQMAFLVGIGYPQLISDQGPP